MDVDGVLRGEDGELVLPGSVHQQDLVVVAVDAQLLVKCWKEKRKKNGMAKIKKPQLKLGVSDKR